MARAHTRAVLLMGLVSLAVTAAAHESPEQLIGTVDSKSASAVRIKTLDGSVVTVQLRPETRYLKADKEASASAIRKGARVAVEAETVGGQWLARLVRIGVVKPLASSPAADEQTHSAHAAGREAPKPQQHEAHTAQPPGGAAAAAGHGEEARNLFQSDMSTMAGMTPRDPMGGMAMPRWTWMSMGIARLQYNRQGGPSGDESVESTNWTMLMGQRDLGGGRLTLMMMNSFEPATLPRAGMPQLFQTGETFEGLPIVDRQHPHDFFMNLSATYRRAMGEQAAWWLQLAPRGEPALGPTAFMHRASAGENPSAILGHHLQDSTHISDGVITAGVGWKRASLEASVFRGKEPDEGRWDLDPGRLDSAAGRLKLSLGRGWSAQVSHGFLKKPEALQEGDVRRTTVSLHYGEKGDRPLAASIVWGHNRERHGTFDGHLVEAAWQLTAGDHLYARAERVDRDLHLLLTKGRNEETRGATGDDEIVAIRSVTLGYLRELKVFEDVPLVDNLHLGLGADLTLYGFPSRLKPVYGESPLSVHVALRLRWGRPHGAMSGHAMQH